jgi:hypothetical protein
VADLGLEPRPCRAGASLACWGHVVAGLAWTTIVLELAAVAGFGVALMTYVIRVHVPRTIRRHEAQLQAHLTATTLAAEERPDEVVDRQSTSHRARSSLTAEASRAH